MEHVHGDLLSINLPVIRYLRFIEQPRGIPHLSLREGSFLNVD